ncbi:MAG TPA: hypothetical protein VFG87_29735 [Amycolatopsis sp.]|nr:hypothetical protein [Amycolatopsis sp.]
MAAELGETTDPRDLIPGDPQAITSDLRALVGNVDGVDGVAQALKGIDPTQWTGTAADAFRAAFGAQPPQWTQVAEAIGKSGQSLADYGDALTWAQGEAQRAIELFTQAQAASRTAAAQYSTQAQSAQAAGQTLAPFQDPGAEGAQSAQSILDNARKQLEQVGGTVAAAFGMEPQDDGTYQKDLGGKEFGGDHRQKQKVKDADGNETEEDPGGWQTNKGGKSYSKEFGSQADGLLGDKAASLLKALGVDVPEATGAASAGVDVAHGSLDGKFSSGMLSGDGKLEGSVLGADASAQGSASLLGVSGSAEAEAYLAKGSADGELKLGDHASVSGHGEAEVGAKASAQGEVNWTGAQASGEAFAGAKASGDASADIGGVDAGVHGEAWAGAGAEASGQVGLGDDGKFHVGASVGLALGVGGKVGFDVSVDPKEVVDTVSDVAGDVGHVASDVGHGAENAAKDVGHFLGF